MQAFETYLAGIADEGQRARTREVLEWVGKTFPQLEPRVAWNQPMFTDHGTFIVGFSVAKGHLAMTPEAYTLKRFEVEIRQAGYAATQMLMRIQWSQPVDWALLKRIIQFNIEDKKGCVTFWRKPEPRA